MFNFSIYFLTLALLEAGILLVDDIQLPLPSHDLTIGAAFFNRCTYFHNNNYYLYLNMILLVVPTPRLTYTGI